MIRESITQVLGEVAQVLSTIDEREVNKLTTSILQARNIVLVGAGRVGLAVRGFAMRLGHLGLQSHMVGDATVPSIGEGDLFLVASGSGETQTIYDLVVIAKKSNARVALMTGNPASRMGALADIIVKIEAPSKTKSVSNIVSLQPMTTLNEQCLGIFFDAVVLRLMEEMKETHDTMWARHSSLE
jgi:6-phospho-3-hexuloisomerase